MRIEFDKLTRQQAEEIVQQKKAEADKAGACENTLMCDGEHFNEGKFWTGPQPATSDVNNPASYTKVKREFASKNGLKDAVDGHRDGVVSREIEWAFTVRRPLAKKGEIVNGVELTEDEKPNEAEQALIREAQGVITPWWNERRMLKLFQDATETLLKTTRSPLRIMIPPAEIKDGKIPLADLPTSINKIFLEACPYDQAAVITDPYSRKDAGVYVGIDGNDKIAEITYVDDSGQTVWKQFVDKAQTATPYTPASGYQSIFSETPTPPVTTDPVVTLKLSGRLLMYEMRRKPFLTPQMRQSNMQLNKAKTLRGHNLNTAGFAETTLLNVDLPGVLVEKDGRQVFVPDPVTRGASVINSWTGVKYTDGAGNERVATPTIDRQQPSPVSTFIESERADYQDILEEAKQMHNLIAGDAMANGVSRVQARGGFALSLNPTKGEVDASVRWTLETVLAIAATFSGQPGRFDSLRANADCRIDTGPITPEEVAMFVMLWDKGVWSLERVQRATGVEDTDAENALIEAAKLRRATLAVAQPAAQQPPVEDKTGQGAIA
jgi:hypothetical protein